jgi:hypothetical protein
MKRATDIERGVGAKYYPTGIEQIQVRPGNSGVELPINHRLLPPVTRLRIFSIRAVPGGALKRTVSPVPTLKRSKL